MPDWNDPELKDIRKLIVRYTRALDTKNYPLLESCFSDEAVLHRGMENYAGKKDIVAWNKRQLESKTFHFELKDASAGVLPDSTARCILWYKIGEGQIHIESLDLVEVEENWLISKCFGLGYDPEHHRGNFDLDE